MKGIIYCRVSSKEQIEGTSLESQKAACTDYARSKNIDVLRVFVEQGESAKFADRTQLLELLEFCRKNKGTVNVLLVWKVDRFARNVTDHFSVKATLGKYGVRILSVTEPIDTNPEGKLMETILAGFAQFDNDIRAMRTVQGMKRKLQEGISPFHPPFGYKSSVAGGGRKLMPDIPDDPAFSLIRRAFREYATGAYTRADIGRLMESWGLQALRGRSFAPQSLYELFTNPYYAGILVDPWTGEEYIGKHTPAVTRREFAVVQRVIAKRDRSVAHRLEREEFPLRGFVRCDACEHGLTGAFSRGRSSLYAYYFCAQRNCHKRAKSIPVDIVHSEFISFLEEVALRPHMIAAIRERVLTIASREQQSRSGDEQRRRKRFEQIQKGISELIRMRAQSLITDDEFSREKQRLTDQRIGLEAQTRQVINPETLQGDLERIIAPLLTLQATWKALSQSQRTRFDRLIFPGGFVIGRIRTAQLGLLFSVFGAAGTQHSGEVHRAWIPPNPIFSEIHEFIAVMEDAEGSFEELSIAV